MNELMVSIAFDLEVAPDSHDHTSSTVFLREPIDLMSRTSVLSDITYREFLGNCISASPDVMTTVLLSPDLIENFITIGSASLDRD